MPAEHPLLTKLARSLQLSEDETAAVRAVAVELIPYRADQMIARQGDKPSRSCLVMDGLLCTSKVIEGGKRQIMAFHIRGDGPDLHSLHLDLLDSDIWAISDCRVAFMPHKDLRALNRAHPRLGEVLWRTSLVDGSIYREWMVNVGQRDAMSRMAHLFCETLLRSEAAGLGEGGTCPFPVTQSDLSEATGLSQVHVNRTLQGLRGQNLISIGKGSLTIHNWDRLAAIADFRADYLHLASEEAA
jgi:CRP-like cAMP-binding protein